MTATISIRDPAVSAFWDKFLAEGFTCLLVGGAVRDLFRQAPVDDFDFATDASPEQMQSMALRWQVKTLLAGVEHGTVCFVWGRRTFQVTTFRTDVATTGRHAKVRFGNDWQIDAQRRDFTINALYAERSGKVLDSTGGLDDLQHDRLRFVGDADRRICEDYLRLLRLVRFAHAWPGIKVEASALEAAKDLVAGLGNLSAERITQEMMRLLALKQRVQAMQMVNNLGMSTWLALSEAKIANLLPASDVDTAPACSALFQLFIERPRLPDNLLARWRLSRSTIARIHRAMAAHHQMGHVTHSLDDAKRLALTFGHPAVLDALSWTPKIGMSAAELAEFEDWKPDRLPVRGRDLLAMGMPPGKEIGVALEAIRKRWIEGMGKDTKASLLAWYQHLSRH